MRKVELHPSKLVFLCSTRKALVSGSPVNGAFFGRLVQDRGGRSARRPLQSYSDFTAARMVKMLITMMKMADMAETA